MAVSMNLGGSCLWVSLQQEPTSLGLKLRPLIFGNFHIGNIDANLRCCAVFSLFGLLLRNLNHHNSETILFSIYPYYGNLN